MLNLRRLRNRKIFVTSERSSGEGPGDWKGLRRWVQIMRQQTGNKNLYSANRTWGAKMLTLEIEQNKVGEVIGVKWSH